MSKLKYSLWILVQIISRIIYCFDLNTWEITLYLSFINPNETPSAISFMAVHISSLEV